MSAVLAATPAACEGPDPAASSFALPPTASSAPAATGETSRGAGTSSTTTEPVHEDSSTSVANTPDVDSDGEPKPWAEAITEAKHGDRDAVVMFSIAKPDRTPWDIGCDLVKYDFPYWYIVDNSELDYRPAFDVATDRVGQA